MWKPELNHVHFWDYKRKREWETPRQSEREWNDNNPDKNKPFENGYSNNEWMCPSGV